MNSQSSPVESKTECEEQTDGRTDGKVVVIVSDASREKKRKQLSL